MTRFEPARIRIGPSVEQRRRCTDETVGAASIESQISRKAEVGEGIPITRQSLGCREALIARDEAANRRIVPEYCRSDDGSSRNFGAGRQNLLGCLEVPGYVV